MNSIVRLAATLAAGAATMYYLDPVAGRRRRALARDRSAAACSDAERYVRGKCQHAADRLQGVIAETRSHVRPQPVDDALLHERVRAKLGHLVGHASGIEVNVESGRVILTGEAGAEEMRAVPSALLRLPGVGAVDSRLAVRPDVSGPGSAPAPAL